MSMLNVVEHELGHAEDGRHLPSSSKQTSMMCSTNATRCMTLRDAMSVNKTAPSENRQRNEHDIGDILHERDFSN
eukprot:CAMPEP_0206491748 /NCGR_PEP_ID=MMETSP0324_2-20121206/45351_1 /ASSEMBLY_ACC=CAM_ASM_000836 /TAXON_ID=2866 /ORGANISM="Crypthecodinium cohnii, Strain Seligo" /LENGTH=74 /DNA_ID=CAMNT_0053973339 /DNA_START=230 /DNA_END=451 /DNA_ORIENTATION=-